MDDIAFVVDEEWRLVYANPRARERTRASAGELQGVSVTTLTDELIATDADRQRFESALETVLAGENNQSPQVVEVELELPTGEAVFEYKLSSLPEGATNGAVVVARDVTERRDRERDLELMGELQSRVLRHNIRNDLNVVRGYAEMFAEEFDDEHAEMAETVVSTADDILSVSEKTRTIEELIQHDQPTETVDLAAMLRRVVDDYRRQFPAVSFALDCPRECRVETVQAVELALAEVIENAAEYGTADNPDVEIATTVEDDIVVTVSDNGPGIPQQELAIRDRGWETKLEHGAGIGLWIVEWLTEISEVAVRYDIGGEGTDVRLRIPGN
jgi:PAS domain S-box-containing protein